MKLHAVNLMERCVQRGYAWDEITPCLTHDLGDGWYEVDVDHPAYPRTRKAGVQPPKAGLGDRVKAGLSAIGITEERVSKAIGRPCGCSKRAEKLNELGRKIGIG
jgi:hypothetical protein